MVVRRSDKSSLKQKLELPLQRVGQRRWPKTELSSSEIADNLPVTDRRSTLMDHRVADERGAGGLVASKCQRRSMASKNN